MQFHRYSLNSLDLWHQVVQLRPDLLSAELPLHLFAADLYEVLIREK